METLVSFGLLEGKKQKFGVPFTFTLKEETSLISVHIRQKQIKYFLTKDISGIFTQGISFLLNFSTKLSMCS
jgi:hypothetical protein